VFGIGQRGSKSWTAHISQRNPSGAIKENRVLKEALQAAAGKSRIPTRLGGWLNYYHREAA